MEKKVTQNVGENALAAQIFIYFKNITKKIILDKYFCAMSVGMSRK